MLETRQLAKAESAHAAHESAIAMTPAISTALPFRCTLWDAPATPNPRVPPWSAWERLLSQSLRRAQFYGASLDIGKCYSRVGGNPLHAESWPEGIDAGENRAKVLTGSSGGSDLP